MTKEEIERAHEVVTKSWAIQEMNMRNNALLEHLERRVQRRVDEVMAGREVLGVPVTNRFGFLNAAVWFVTGAAVTYWILRSIEAAE